MSVMSTYTVKGMTCDGCVRKVSAAVGELPGVSDVDADVATGELTVFSDRPVEATSVRTVLQKIGYKVA
jgi:copper chaperone